MARVFEVHRISWSILGRDNPWWSVLTAEEFRGTDPSAHVKDKFYASGDHDVDPVLELIKKEGVELDFDGAVLDFGCGLGRVSMSLARFFKEVYCVDQSTYHLERAAKETALKDPTRSSKITFVLSDPRLLWSLDGKKFDFLFSHITLQHIIPTVQVIYIQQFCDAMKPGGYIYFQIPYEEWISPFDCTIKLEQHSGMMMYGIRRDEMNNHMRLRGCEFVAEWIGNWGGGPDGRVLYRKTTSKPLPSQQLPPPA